MKAAAASEAHVAQAAREALSRGNAVDAVVAGVLAAAALEPGVLLGPVQLLAGGTGAGLLAIDGRVCQPGQGAPRPRGFVPGEAVPEAARVGVPALPAALAAALALLGTTTLAQAAAAAVRQARAASPERATVLRALARQGAAALASDAISSELTAVAGRAARGVLTQEDLASLRPQIVRCEERALPPSGLLRAPWRDEQTPRDASRTQLVAAADVHGLVAIACYEVTLDGLHIPALGLVAPLCAAPVMRGEVRVRPGQPRPAAAPVALRARGGIVDLALGVAACQDGEEALSAMVEAIGVAATLGKALPVPRGGRPVALVITPRAAKVLASA